MSTSPQSSKNKWINLYLYLLLALIWSGSFINIKVVVDALPPVFCAMIRVLISLISLCILFKVMRKKVFTFTTDYWRLWMAGLFTQAFPFALLFYGEKFIAPALASIINSSVAIWSLVLGTFVFRDFAQWTPLKIAGVASGFMGIILILFPYVNENSNNLIGILAILAMAISYAIGGLINQHVIFKKMSLNFETNIIQQHIASVLFLLATSLIMESWPSIASIFNIKILPAFLYLGMIATAIAWIIYFHLIREWGALRTASVMYIVPVMAIVWDLLFLHLIPNRNELIGMLAILIGVILIQWTRRKNVG